MVRVSFAVVSREWIRENAWRKGLRIMRTLCNGSDHGVMGRNNCRLNDENMKEGTAGYMAVSA